jgi:hypothetical protein
MNEHDNPPDPAGLRRYTDLVERTFRAPPLDPAFVPAAESCAAVQVERGTVYPRVLRAARDASLPSDLPLLLELPCDLPLTPRNVVDAQGHRRPPYRGLLFHAVFRAMAADATGQLTPFASIWIPLLRDQLASLRWPDHPPDRIPADRGAPFVDVVWMSLAAHDAVEVGADSISRTRAADAFERLVTCQHPQGTFLTPSPSDNPETLWYHELVLLHAATLYAAETRDPALAAAVARNAAFHQAETQPDHATNQPWGLAAFARTAATRPFADQMLHAAATLGGQSGVTSILLADALYCLRLWTAHTA